MTTIEQNPLADAYILMAWELLRGDNPKGGRYPAVHTTWTPFNNLFRQIFPGIDPVAYTKMLQAKGLIELGFARGGAMVKPCEAFLKPAPEEHKETISQMRRLLEDAAATLKAQRAEAEARKKAANGKPATKAEAQAMKAWVKGDTAAALKRLGYGG